MQDCMAPKYICMHTHMHACAHAIQHMLGSEAPYIHPHTDACTQMGTEHTHTLLYAHAHTCRCLSAQWWAQRCTQVKSRRQACSWRTSEGPLVGAAILHWHLDPHDLCPEKMAPDTDMAVWPQPLSCMHHTIKVALPYAKGAKECWESRRDNRTLQGA